jgi:hypothetical protein
LLYKKNWRSKENPMATRLLGQTPTPIRASKAPTRPDDWKQLLRKAIRHAENTDDRRLEGLKQALVDSLAEKRLRLFGIIHEGDLIREFPPKP